MYAFRHIPASRSAHPNPTFPPRRRRWRRLLAAMASGAAVVGVAHHVDAHEHQRPHVTIHASRDGLMVPAVVPGGLVDITLDTDADDDDPAGVGHHLVIARLDDGITLDEAMAAGDEAYTTMMTVKGGNGTIAAGSR